MKKFAKKDLMNKLDFTEDESKLIMDAQNQFPSILADDGKGFCLSGRMLHSELGVSKAFSTWIKTNLELVDASESNDFEIRYDDSFEGNVISASIVEDMSPQQRSRMGISEEYFLTIRCAKEIAMIAGTSGRAGEELRVNSKRIRKYFILLEEAVKRNIDWIEVREPQKQGYKDMCSAIKQSYEESHDGKECNKFLYSTNADMINLALFGYKSKQMKELLDLEYDEQLRENLRIESNKALANLQMLNESLNYDNIDFQTRRKVIEATCQRKYIGLRMRVVSEFNKEIANFPKEDK